jgi:hypothetical protein
MQPIPLFLDIDGVFSIKHEHIQSERINGIKVHPIPMCAALLQALDRDPAISPVWLTSWGDMAQAWNKRYGTAKWPVAYPLDVADAAKADRQFPRLHNNKPDDKLIAVWWYLRDLPKDTPVMWMEDGFAVETVMWAHERGNARLIDTRNPEILADLAQKCADQQECVQAAREFMRQWIDAKVNV